MATDETSNATRGKRIVVRKNGPYLVEGDVPLVRKTQVVSEYGEPLTWQKEDVLAVSEGEYYLCRCGRSSDQPFCDATHRAVGFDGTESADTGETEDARDDVSARHAHHRQEGSHALHGVRLLRHARGRHRPVCGSHR